MVPHDITLTFRGLAVLLSQYIDLYQDQFESVFSYLNKLIKKNVKDPKLGILMNEKESLLDPYSMCCMELLYSISKHAHAIYYFYLLNNESSVFSKILKHMGAILEKNISSSSLMQFNYKISSFSSRPFASFVIPEEVTVDKEDINLYLFYTFKEFISSMNSMVQAYIIEMNVHGIERKRAKFTLCVKFWRPFLSPFSTLWWLFTRSIKVVK